MSFVERSSLSQRVPYRRFHCILKCAVCSGTSDSGHSEEGTISLRWTNCSPSAYTFEGQPLNNGQNTCPQSVRGATVKKRLKRTRTKQVYCSSNVCVNVQFAVELLIMDTLK